LRRKFQCWGTSWNITWSQAVIPKRRSLAASLPKNSFGREKGKKGRSGEKERRRKG
jgi:hypothetical protein